MVVHRYRWETRGRRDLLFAHLGHSIWDVVAQVAVEGTCPTPHWPTFPASWVGAGSARSASGYDSDHEAPKRQDSLASVANP